MCAVGAALGTLYTRGPRSRWASVLAAMRACAAASPQQSVCSTTVICVRSIHAHEHPRGQSGEPLRRRFRSGMRARVSLPEPPQADAGCTLGARCRSTHRSPGIARGDHARRDQVQTKRRAHRRSRRRQPPPTAARAVVAATVAQASAPLATALQAVVAVVRLVAAPFASGVRGQPVGWPPCASSAPPTDRQRAGRLVAAQLVAARSEAARSAAAPLAVVHSAVVQVLAARVALARRRRRRPTAALTNRIRWRRPGCRLSRWRAAQLRPAAAATGLVAVMAAAVATASLTAAAAAPATLPKPSPLLPRTCYRRGCPAL